MYDLDMVVQFYQHERKGMRSPITAQDEQGLMTSAGAR